MPAAISSRPACGRCSPASAAWRWNTRPGCAIPYVSRIDAGTVELIRQAASEVVSSGDLIQRFSAVWDAGAIETHRLASERLYRVKDRAFDDRRAPAPRRRRHDRVRHPAADGRLVSRRRAGQRFGRRTSRRRRTPATRTTCRPPPRTAPSARTRSCCSISGASSTGRARSTPTSPGSASPARAAPERYVKAFAAVCAARDAGIRLVQDAAARRPRAARLARSIAPPPRCCATRVTPITILHRTGHSLGETVHGNGVNMDDYETHDDRRLLAGHRVHDRAGRLLRRLRRSDGNQHDRRPARRGGDRTAADRDSWHSSSQGGQNDVNPQDHAFYAVLLVVASLFVGMVIASRLDLTPASSAQTIAVPPMNSAPLTGAARRVDVPQHREGADADGRQHPHRDEGEGAGPDRLLRRRRRRRPTISSTASSAARGSRTTTRRRRRAAAAAAADRRRSASRRRARPAPASSSARTASSSPTTTSSRTRPRSKCRSTPTRRTSATRRR